MDETRKIDGVLNGMCRNGVASAAREAIADVTSWCEQLVVKMRDVSDLYEKDCKALRAENAHLAAKLQVSTQAFTWPLNSCGHSNGGFHEIVCSADKHNDPSAVLLKNRADDEDKQFQCVADEASVSLAVGHGFFVARFQPPLIARAEEAARLARSTMRAEDSVQSPRLPVRVSFNRDRDSGGVRERIYSMEEKASMGCILGDVRCGDIDDGNDLSRSRSSECSWSNKLTNISRSSGRKSERSVNFHLTGTDETDISKIASTIIGRDPFYYSGSECPSHHNMVRFKVCEDFGNLRPSNNSGHGQSEQATTMHKLSETIEDLNLKFDELERAGSSGELKETKACTACMFLRRPSSPFRITWECLGVLFLMYDSVMIPMQAFPMPETIVLGVVAWVILNYWTLDVGLSFLVGFYKDDHLVLDLGEIAHRYTRSWFGLDLVIIGVDWVSILTNLLTGGGFSMDGSSGGSNNLGVMRAGKVLRILRLMRLLRIMKLSQSNFLIILQERLESERLYVMSNMMKNVCVVLAINHLTACTWYWIGSAPIGDEECWVQHYEIDKRTWVFAYLTSVHWSLAQFANGEILIEPQSIPERLFCIFVLVMSIIIFSAFLAVVGNTVSQLIQTSARRRRDHFILRLYLRQQDISFDLKMRANRYVGVMLCKGSDRVNHQDVKLFEMLSRPLQNELLTELYLQHLRAHPFFSMMATRSQTIVRNLCCQAVRQVLLSRGDILFSVGEEGKEMYFVHVGTLYYNPHQAAKVARICAGDWFCEAVLWIDKWLTCGRMAARTECELVAMDARKFREVVKGHHTTTHRLPRDYANAFVDSLNSFQESAHLTDYQMDLVRSEQVLGVLAWWQNRRAMSTRFTKKLECVSRYDSEEL